MTESTSTPTTQPVRRRRDAAEAAALVVDWRSSGLNKEAFCRSRGILRSTLSSCLERVTSREIVPSGFVEVRPARGQPESSPGGLMLDLGDGLRLVGMDEASAVAVIAALRRTCR